MNLKPQNIVDKKVNAIIGFMVFALTLLIYGLTMARSTSFWDCGEYITCSSILGIPHPPGNPFYILLGRFISIFTGSNHAISINFLSSIMGALATMFTYLFTVKIISMFETKKIYLYLGGLIAAIYTGFAATFWANSIEAEVYSGLALVINLIVWLTFVWLEKSENLSHQNILMLIGYIFFLGFGIHQTSLQIAPAVMVVVLYPFLRKQVTQSSFWIKTVIYACILIAAYVIFTDVAKAINIPDLAKIIFALIFSAILIYYLRNHVHGKTWLFGLFFIIIAFSTHIFLFIRSEFRPFINEGHPHNFKLFMDYFLRRQYGVTSFTVRRADFFYQLKDQFLTYFSWQYFEPLTISNWTNLPQNLIRTLSNLFITFLGLGGIFYHLKKNKHSFIYWLNFFFWSSLAMVFVINLSDKEVRTREYFFVTAYNFWTVWLAIGSIGIIKILASKGGKSLMYVMMALMIFFPIFNLASQYFVHDRSREYIALDYGLNILNSVEKDAILFTNGDNDTFPLWYAQAVHDNAAWENIYPPTDVLPTEKTKQLIAKSMEFKNKQCNGVRKDVSLANLSLLNTPWYIQQLRDREGIEFNWTNEQILNIAPSVAFDTSIQTADISSWEHLLRIIKNPRGTSQKKIVEVIDENLISKLPASADNLLESDKKAIVEELNKLHNYQLDYNLFQSLQEEGYQLQTGIYFLLQKIQEGTISRTEMKGLNNILISYAFAGSISNRKYFYIPGNEVAKPFYISFPKGKILMIKDISTIKLIRENYGKRPIYFAVTVSDYCGFENNMRGEGMVERLVSERKSMNIDVDRTRQNIYKIYSYRGVQDDSIYKDKNMTRLLNNYGAPFMKLASYYRDVGNYRNALKAMMEGLKFYSDKEGLYDSILGVGAAAVHDAVSNEKFDDAYEFLDILFPIGKKDPNFASLIQYVANQSKMPQKADSLLKLMDEYQQSLINKSE